MFFRRERLEPGGKLRHHLHRGFDANYSISYIAGSITVNPGPPDHHRFV